MQRHRPLERVLATFDVRRIPGDAEVLAVVDDVPLLLHVGAGAVVLEVAVEHRRGVLLDPGIAPVPSRQAGVPFSKRRDLRTVPERYAGNR